MMTPINVIGAGSWGTALALVLARNGHPVQLIAQTDAHAAQMQAEKENARYLPGHTLSKHLTVSADLKTALSLSERVLIAVPSHAFREVLARVHYLAPGLSEIIWATKGLDPDTNQFLDQVTQEIFSDKIQCGVIAGPSFANEVASQLPTAVVLAATSAKLYQKWLNLFSAPYFRVYASEDMIGAQIGGTVKNVLAIAAGISDGLLFGANARAALITRGLAEMMRLGEALGAQRHTLTGLSGMGDLLLTCTDDQSRNRRFGLALGQGASIEEAQKSVGQVVEGYGNVAQLIALSQQHQVDMPIVKEVAAVLEGKSPKTAVQSLFDRPLKLEA